MGGRGANSSSTNSIRRFSKMNPEEAFSEYYKLENYYYKDILKVNARETSRSIFRGQLNKNFSKLKTEEIRKTYQALQEKIKSTIKQQKKEKIQREKRLKEQEKFYKKYGRNAIKAKYDGFDREGNRIKVGDIIKRTDKGWEKWKSK